MVNMHKKLNCTLEGGRWQLIASSPGGLLLIIYFFSDNKDYRKTLTGLKYFKEYELSAVPLQPSTDKNGIQDE